MIAILSLALVILLIIFRRVGKVDIPIYLAMVLGATLVLLFGAISPSNALLAIDLKIIIFLFGVFSIGRALEMSGLAEDIAYKLLKKASNYEQLLILIIFGAGFFSALIMNDTIAIIGTPIVILIARSIGLDPKVFLLTLAFSVTIGSVPSPIGNPQNLLVALRAMQDPFINFLKFLALPTIINLFAIYLVIKYFFPSPKINNGFKLSTISMTRDKALARLTKISIDIFFLLIVLKVLTNLLKIQFLDLEIISILGALPLIIFSKRRIELLKTIDWQSIVLFIAMFILIQAVWDEGIFQKFVLDSNFELTKIETIFFLSIIGSQIISNVPFTNLFLNLLSNQSAGLKEYLALAAGSTIAGNLTVIGAASNMIILSAAQKRGYDITFFEFFKIGLVLTILNLIIYYIFLVL